MRYIISLIFACAIWFGATQAMALDAVIAVDSSFTCVDGCIGFSAESSTPVGYIDEVAWDWENDGSYDEIGSMEEYGTVCHQWASGGAYRVKLRVHQDGIGYDYELTDWLYVGEPVIVVNSYCVDDDNPTGFDGTSSLPSSLSKTYEWDFDDNQSIDSTSGTPSWTFSNTGWNTVRLWVTYNGNTAWKCETSVNVWVVDNCP